MKICEIYFIGVNNGLLASVSQLSEFYTFNEQRPDYPAFIITHWQVQVT